MAENMAHDPHLTFPPADPAAESDRVDDSTDDRDVDSAIEARLPALIAREVARRRTFGIISHPDAGKTTLTEKLLLFSGAIQMAGTVKARKSGRHATSDWMEIEKQRGISVASSEIGRAHV